MKFVPKILLVAVLLTAYSCKRFPNPFAEHNTILAEVENKKLYLHDVSPIFTPNMTSEDSLKILRSYVDQWVKKQLKIKEAERMLEESQKDIDQMVQEYRNSLLTHKVDQFYVDKNIDTLFTDTQIADYYNQNKADFILDKTLVKARIVRIPRSYDKKKTIEELMLTPREDGYQDLLDLCVKNNFELTELNQWTRCCGRCCRSTRLRITTTYSTRRKSMSSKRTTSYFTSGCCPFAGPGSMRRRKACGRSSNGSFSTNEKRKSSAPTRTACTAGRWTTRK